LHKGNKNTTCRRSDITSDDGRRAETICFTVRKTQYVFSSKPIIFPGGETSPMNWNALASSTVHQQKRKNGPASSLANRIGQKWLLPQQPRTLQNLSGELVGKQKTHYNQVIWSRITKYR